jgi:NAD(P)-dependent dehydrogenase (short-subunit alcohol dehydrogenase family)
METVLVVGATGNIGVSAVTAALRSKRNVLAIVRNQNSADKLVKYIGSSEGITFVEASVTSDTGIKGVVDQVRAGKLPAFQHVYSCGAFSPSLCSVHTHLAVRFLIWGIRGTDMKCMYSRWRVYCNSPHGNHHGAASPQHEQHV